MIKIGNNTRNAKKKKQKYEMIKKFIITKLV